MHCYPTFLATWENAVQLKRYFDEVVLDYVPESFVCETDPKTPIELKTGTCRNFACIALNGRGPWSCTLNCLHLWVVPICDDPAFASSPVSCRAPSSIVVLWYVDSYPNLLTNWGPALAPHRQKSSPRLVRKITSVWVRTAACVWPACNSKPNWYRKTSTFCICQQAAQTSSLPKASPAE